MTKILPSPLFLLLIAYFYSGISPGMVRSALTVSLGACPERSIRLQEVCALYRILSRHFDCISLSFLPFPPLYLPILSPFSPHLTVLRSSLGADYFHQNTRK